jgi:hypothetical protein
MQFSIIRFRRYARDLSIAIYELSKEQQLALELKGLKAKAIKARSSIDALNTAYDKFNEAAPAHAADVASLTEQLSGMQDDLQFAVTTLGNSVGEQEKPAETAPTDNLVMPQGLLSEVPSPPPNPNGPRAIWAELGQP